MAKYAIPFSKGAANVLQIMYALADGTRPRRGKLYDFNVGCTTPSDDGVSEYVVRRVTNAGTASTATPSPIDPADAATELDASDTVTTDASSFAAGILLDRIALNNRATWRWMAGQGAELIYPATATNGLSIGLTAASTKTYSGKAAIDEQ